VVQCHLVRHDHVSGSGGAGSGHHRAHRRDTRVHPQRIPQVRGMSRLTGCAIAPIACSKANRAFQMLSCGGGAATLIFAGMLDMGRAVDDTCTPGLGVWRRLVVIEHHDVPSSAGCARATSWMRAAGWSCCQVMPIAASHTTLSHVKRSARCARRRLDCRLEWLYDSARRRVQPSFQRSA